uniref:Putative secreted protein n=1 Tax=Ixodes ricinus TaxID=34613 RepID=A0A6B0U2W1_IXORI
MFPQQSFFSTLILRAPVRAHSANLNCSSTPAQTPRLLCDHTTAGRLLESFAQMGIATQGLIYDRHERLFQS